MHTDQIYIARDGKSGMHVLVRILAVDDIGVDYPPIDPDNFNKLMMARDVKSLVLAARDLGPMYISADILSRRTFIPSHLQQDIECGFNLIPPNLESLLSECYFDPYAIPDEIAGMGYRAIGRTGKKATRELINDFDFTIAGDLSYLDSQFRAIVEPLHDWVFARNLLSILMRIGGLYRSGADPDTILEAARFRQVNPMVLKKRFDIDTDTCYAIPIAFNPIYRMENLADKDSSEIGAVTDPAIDLLIAGARVGKPAKCGKVFPFQLLGSDIAPKIALVPEDGMDLVRHHLDVDHIAIVTFPVTGSRLLQKILGNRLIAVFIQNLTVFRQSLFNLT